MRPDLTTAIVVLTEVQPGIFEVSVQANAAGVYQFRVRAEGQLFVASRSRVSKAYRAQSTRAATIRLRRATEIRREIRQTARIAVGD